MKRKMRNVISIIIAVSMIFVVLTACGKTKGNEEKTTEPTTTKSKSTTTTTAAATTEKPGEDTLEWENDKSPITFTIFHDYPGPKYKGWGQDDISKWITEQTGVSLELQWATTNDSRQLNTMIASNSLPDFVYYFTNTPVRTILWKQGFLYPVNELIDKYAPKTWDILPKDMDLFYTESDGNMYVFPQLYSVPEEEIDIPGNSTVNGAMTINRSMYKEIGEPPMGTLDEYKEALRMVRDKYRGQGIFPSFMGTPHQPLHDGTNMVQLINRIYGGNPTRVIENDKVYLNFRDEEYLSAVKFINSLYREELFLAENFTSAQNNKEVFDQLILNEKIFSFWGQCVQAGYADMSETAPYWPAEPPKVEGITPKFRSVLGTIGLMNRGLSISKNCRNPERAIKFVQFLFTYEAQMAVYHGLEGVHIVYEDGMPRATEYKLNYMNDWGKMGYELGITGPYLWAATIETDSYYYYWLNKDKPFYGAINDIYKKYERVERMENIITVSSDSNEKVIETKIEELWASSLPKMLLADSEEQCINAYNTFVKEAERLGLADLEKAYTENYLEWKNKLERKQK